MPLSSITSYPPTLQSFLDHWSSVESNLGAAFVLPDGTTKEMLEDITSSINAAIGDMTGPMNTLEAAAFTRNTARATVVGTMSLFNRAVRGILPRTIYTSMLASVPSPAADAGKVLGFARDTQNNWLRINAIAIANKPANLTLPFVLPDGTTAAQFGVQLMALDQAARAWDEATGALRLARQTRDGQMLPVAALLAEYSAQVRGRFLETNPLVMSLPRVRPLPGTTPPRVEAGGAWDAVNLVGKITVVPLSAAIVAQFGVSEYQLRYSPDSKKYDADGEQVVANIAPTETLFTTTQGLLSPATRALFRVYVMTDTGNEKGSLTVSVLRPSS